MKNRLPKTRKKTYRSHILIVIFLVVSQSLFCQNDISTVDIVVYNPKSIFFPKIRIALNDSLVFVLRSGRYAQLKNVKRSDVIQLKLGKFSRNHELASFPTSLNKLYFRFCWENRWLKKPKLSLLPIYANYAVEEIKELLPICQ